MRPARLFAYRATVLESCTVTRTTPKLLMVDRGERRREDRRVHPASCPFCRVIATGGLAAANERACALADAFPVSRGHSLVVPRRHEASYFNLTSDEQQAIWALVAEVQANMDRELAPAGYNVGINIGAAAGQTVWHAHVHVIPRYLGDADDPRGGVRHVIPSKAAYWKQAR